MINSFFKYRKSLFFIFISTCCLIIYGVSQILLPPSSKTDDLKLLLLNKETAPVFKFSSQFSYSHETINNWTSHLGTNPPKSKEESMNLSIQLDFPVNDFSTLSKDLDLLSSYFSHFSLSILPSENMNDQIYIATCQELFNFLHMDNNLSFSLIAYPPTVNNLSDYEAEYITSVGTVLKSESDLENFSKMYKYFKGKKTLVVQDDVKRHYESTPTVATSEITKLYYLLAIEYPEVDTIFSPYVLSSFDLEDDYSIKRSDPDYYLFYTIYNRLLEKVWITTDNSKTVTAASPYVPLNSYDELADESEIILSPDAQILKELQQYKVSTGVSPYLNFKWNNEYLSVTSSYPYSMTLNDATMSNGVSRLTAILQDEQLNTLCTSSIDLTVNHPVENKRAKRIDTPGVSNTLSNTEDTIQISKNYIPILMYHTVADTVSEDEQNSCVETKVFESQMKALVDAGYTPINFYDLKRYTDGLATLPEHPILITMDDGYVNNYTNAYPIYKKYQIQATLFVSPYYMQEENTERHFGWKAAREMEASGLIDIQAHGYDHTPFPYLSLKDLRYHITQAQGLIEMNLGARDVSVVACPQFRNTKYTRKLLSELGVDFQITKLAKKGTVLNPSSLKRINVPNTMSPEELLETLDNLTA